MQDTVVDAAGRPRPAVTLPGYHAGRPPRNKGRRYPADPPTVEEIVAVIRTCDAGVDGTRLRALIVLLWRAGLRISEALALTESDLDPRRGAILVRHGKGDKRREIGMDAWAWEQLEPWSELRPRWPPGTYFCVVHGPTAGRPWEPSSARRQLARIAIAAGVRRRFAPHQLRHAHAVEMSCEGVPLVVIHRQLGHANLGVTSIYLQGIDNSEIIDAVYARRPPVVLALPGPSRTRGAPPATASTPTITPTARAAPRRTRSRRQPAPTPARPIVPTYLHG